LTDNDHVKVSEVNFAPGAVADWHSHPQHTVYAVTDVKMREEVKGKEAVTAEMKAGQAMWSPAVTHVATNVGKTAFTIIVTEIK
jgi:beta-alanine degradation protein BauB